MRTGQIFLLPRIICPRPFCFFARLVYTYRGDFFFFCTNGSLSLSLSLASQLGCLALLAASELMSFETLPFFFSVVFCVGLRVGPVLVILAQYCVLFCRFFFFFAHAREGFAVLTKGAPTACRFFRPTAGNRAVNWRVSGGARLWRLTCCLFLSRNFVPDFFFFGSLCFVFFFLFFLLRLCVFFHRGGSESQRNEVFGQVENDPGLRLDSSKVHERRERGKTLLRPSCDRRRHCSVVPTLTCIRRRKVSLQTLRPVSSLCDVSHGS